MSATRLLILGLLRWMQPAHGYDIRRELLSWSAEKWGDLRPGSVYHALKTMAVDGLLEEVGSERVGNRPARTTYRLTDRGEIEFRELLTKFWWDYDTVYDPFLVALSFLPALSQREAAAALRNRAKLVAATIDAARVHLDSDWMAAKPPHVAEIFRLGIARGEAEIAWCERVAERVDRGELHPRSDEPTARRAGWQ
jgi:DNA-binding PadR family transcriptional regulator